MNIRPHHLLLGAAIAAALFATVAQAADPLSTLRPNDLVLFQGDSITEGGRQRTGSDYNHIMGQDYAYIIAARVGAEYAERNLTFINRGISGNTIIDLAVRWQTDTLALKPNVLSILIGINDLNVGIPKGETVAQYEQTYDKLLTDTLTACPGVRIVLCEPFTIPIHQNQVGIDAAHAALRPYQDVVHRLGDKYHLPVVPYQRAFDDAIRKAPAEHWCWDGVHPTYAGHGLMAQQWLDTVDRWRWK